MEGGGVYDDSHLTLVLLKNETTIPCTNEVLESLWIPNSSPPFQGSGSMVNFEDVRGETTTERPFFSHIDPKLESCNDEIDGYLHQPEKKRRLSPDQVLFLEKSFEVENKLEPERKVQLAKELGLQPRQVAIWFQNRRARYKTKQLEKDYDSLKSNYDKLMADFDTLSKENEKMKNEIHLLSEKLLLKENGKPKGEPMEPIRPLALDVPPASNVVPPVMMNCKQEDAASSARSDIFDSDSPHYTDGNHSGFMEPANSSHVFDSDFSQDEDDSLSRGLLPIFPKLESVECYDDLQPNSCNLGFPAQEHGTWFWQY